LPDKCFDWASPHDGFHLNTSTGMITLLSGTSNDTFVLKFIVTEKGQNIPSHQVHAYVNVTVKELPEEAVDRSGSIRFYGITAEQFVEPDESGVSKKEIFQEKLATMLNTSVENVDVFTVLHSPHYNNRSLLDIRFSAHGSPYYAPEKLNTIVAQHSKEIEREIKADPFEKTGGEPSTLSRFRRDVVKNDRTHELATEISCRKVYDHFAPSCTNVLFPYFYCR